MNFIRRKKVVRILAALMAVCLTACLFAGCEETGRVPEKDPEKATKKPGYSTEIPETSEDSLPLVTMVIKDYGMIILELYPEYAPTTVNNFISLANSGFYDGLTFHRVVEGFMIQGGDPEGTGGGGPGYSIKGEFSGNGYTQNTLSHERGVISMARAMSPDSAGSQFFIVHADSKYLDGQYAAFGRVIAGMDVVDEIAACEVDNPYSMSPRPVNAVVIERVTVDTKGIHYPEPEKLPG